MVKKRCKTLIFLILLFLPGCATFYNPATGQKEYLFVTTPAEVSIGKTLSAEISKEYDISDDPDLTARVNKIGDLLKKVSDRQDLAYHFYVINDDSLNAFTTPGGYVYVNSGLVKKATDDELACVIGHEIGHIAARHIAKKLQAKLGYDILMNIALRKAGLRDFQKAISVSYNLILLGYSREDELLADRLGAKYAYRADYDPYAMISFLKKLKKTEKDSMGFVFLRSHPYVDKRIKMMELYIPSMIKSGSEKSVYAGRQTTVNRKEGAAVAKKRRTRVMCPVCRRIFDANRAKFCPYDGSRLR